MKVGEGRGMSQGFIGQGQSGGRIVGQAGVGGFAEGASQGAAYHHPKGGVALSSMRRPKLGDGQGPVVNLSGSDTSIIEGISPKAVPLADNAHRIHLHSEQPGSGLVQREAALPGLCPPFPWPALRTEQQGKREFILFRAFSKLLQKLQMTLAAR